MALELFTVLRLADPAGILFAAELTADDGKDRSSGGSSSKLMLPSAEMNPENIIIIYNRIPKTGSTSFMGLLYDVCVRNNFHVIHLNTSRNTHVMSLSDQLIFGQNFSNWVTRKPAVYHGHIAYIDFER
ncbi:unnamed protein product [Soboliphyme baturini]|uniref:Sulfotransferase domain-containing protein n=1 Tax=Soboliphyme baturini TaxID=241478 RepID=A0A183J7G9_9BILA|nr:unnamed protein product [Soboliphyme baturini]